MLDGSLILVRLVTGPIRQEGIQQLLDTISNIPWDRIEETDSQARAEGATEHMLEERQRAQELKNYSKLEG